MTFYLPTFFTQTIFLSLVCLTLGCNRKTAPSALPETSSAAVPTGDNSRTSLDWSGTYIGSIPNSEGQEVSTGLHLSIDQTYRLETEDAGAAGEPYLHQGRFEWDADGESIKLLNIDSTDRAIYYQVGENSLRQLDLVKQSIEGKLTDRYRLQKDTTGLFGTTWNLATLDGRAVEMGKRQPTLDFAMLTNRLSGNGGCNRYRTEFTVVADGHIDIAPPAATKMACPELETEQEFFEALMGAISYEFIDGTLLLRDAEEAEVATFKQ